MSFLAISSKFYQGALDSEKSTGTVRRGWKRKAIIADAWRRADGRIAPRSGLAVKNFIDTGAGVIDADYRGEVKVLLFNHADIDFRGTPSLPQESPR